MVKKERYEQSIGAVISYPAPPSKTSSLSISESKITTGIKFLILRSHSGDWNFVKGHQENGENDEDTLRGKSLKRQVLLLLNSYIS